MELDGISESLAASMMRKGWMNKMGAASTGEVEGQSRPLSRAGGKRCETELGKVAEANPGRVKQGGVKQREKPLCNLSLIWSNDRPKRSTWKRLGLLVLVVDNTHG